MVLEVAGVEHDDRSPGDLPSRRTSSPTAALVIAPGDVRAVYSNMNSRERNIDYVFAVFVFFMARDWVCGAFATTEKKCKTCVFTGLRCSSWPRYDKSLHWNPWLKLL